MKKTISIPPSANEVVMIDVTQPVKVQVSFTEMDLEETLKCGNCLHLSQRESDGFIPQTNSSNLGVGFIRVNPVNEIIELVIKHDYPTPKNVEVIVDIFQ